MAYKDFHPTIHAVGDEECLASLIERSITEFEDLSLTEVSAYSMSACDRLSRVALPLGSILRSSTFMYDSELVEFKAPRLDNVTQYAFEECSKLKSLEFVTQVGIAFESFLNSALETLVLSYPHALTKLDNINAFTGTPIANGTGYIYVPKKMADGRDGIAAYEAATNWSTFAGQFRYIEDYPEITGGLHP